LLVRSPALQGPKFLAPMNAVVEQSPKTAYERLPRRYRRFVDAYVEGNTGAESARLSKCKSLYPHNRAWEWLQRPEIRQAIDEREAHAVREAGVRHVRTLKELQAIAYADPRRLVHPETGKALLLKDLPAEIAAAISGVDVEEISINGESGTRYKYKFWDKNKALDKLGQYLKLWDSARATVNVDARTLNVNTASGPEALSGAVRLLEQVRSIAVSAAAAVGDQDGSLLPAPVRDESKGRRASVDAGEDSGSPGAT
jgi:hypothetical protein